MSKFKVGDIVYVENPNHCGAFGSSTDRKILCEIIEHNGVTLKVRPLILDYRDQYVVESSKTMTFVNGYSTKLWRVLND